MLFKDFVMEVPNVVAIILAGLMVGCELAVAAFVAQSECVFELDRKKRIADSAQTR
jgi:hypothetical protein